MFNNRKWYLAVSFAYSSTYNSDVLEMLWVCGVHPYVYDPFRFWTKMYHVPDGKNDEMRSIDVVDVLS